MKAVAYIRVSSREQDEGIQRQAIEQFATSRGIEILEWYPDAGESGAKPFRDRPQASRLLQELEQLKPDVILAWSLDRLGRTMLDTLNTMLDLEAKGYRVVTVKEEWLQTLDDNIRKLILGILAWVAEFERRRIRERQEEAWRQGKRKGRPPKISGEEVERYIRRYPTLSIRALAAVINADRQRRGQPPVAYRTVYTKARGLGYRKRLVKA